MVFAFARLSKFDQFLHKIVFETLSVLRMRLETHLIRFWSCPDSIFDQFWAQSGRGFGVWRRLRSVTEPNWTDIFIQNPFQSPLKPLWKRFGINFGTILRAKMDEPSIVDRGLIGSIFGWFWKHVGSHPISFSNPTKTIFRSKLVHDNWSWRTPHTAPSNHSLLRVGGMA